jgi:protein phosphatase
VGRVREVNEDRWFADPHQGLYLVADGIGGAVGGGLASQIVAEVLPRLLRQKLEGIEDFADLATRRQVLAALVQLSDRLRDESRTSMGFNGIGSTVVLALVRDLQGVVAHMGDSRAYLLRGGQLEQLTKDHTLAQLLIDRGEMTLDEANTHPDLGQLTRYVGMGAESLPEAKCVALAPGDRLLLCSDGLSRMLSHRQILDVLSQQPIPDQACRHLIAAANQAGGSDNITAVVVTLEDRGAR